MTLSVENLTTGYGTTRIIDGATTSAPCGALTVLIGPNGTGKSTLLKALAGLIPSSGRVSLNGTFLSTEGRREFMAYMPQDTGASSSLTALEVVLLGRVRSLGLSVPDALPGEAFALLRRFGIDALSGRSLDALSGGQRQLVFLAQALFRKPKVLLLDEPTAALDLRHQLVVLNAVRDHACKHGVVAIAAMHDLPLAAQFAARVVCLENGTVNAAGTSREVLTEDRIRTVYGVEAAIADTPAGFLSITPLRPYA